MSRPAQIRFLSRFARAYDPAVRLMGFARLWRAVAELARPVRGERALDVCTGTGGVAHELARLGAVVTGADLADGMLRRAAMAWPVEGSGRTSWLRLDARSLPFADRSFPLVTCAMALHEMSRREREAVVREIARVAAERVLLADYRVPPEGARRMLFRAARAFEYLESDDFEGFIRRDPGQMLEEAGLRVTREVDRAGYRIWVCRPGGAVV